MNEKYFRVVKSGEKFAVKSEKSEGGSLDKRILVLQELGGRYENQYVVAVLGRLAKLDLKEGDLVIAVLKFQTREYNGQIYQDVTANELIKLQN